MTDSEFLAWAIEKIHTGSLTHKDAERLVKLTGRKRMTDYMGEAACSPLTVEYVESLCRLLEVLGVDSVLEVCARRSVLARMMQNRSSGVKWVATDSDPQDPGVLKQEWDETVPFSQHCAVYSSWPYLGKRNKPCFTDLAAWKFLGMRLPLILLVPQTEEFLGSWLGKAEPATSLVEGFIDPPQWQENKKYGWDTAATVVVR